MAALLRVRGLAADVGGIHDEAFVLRVRNVEVVVPGLVCWVFGEEEVEGFDQGECGVACVALQVADGVCCVSGEESAEKGDQVG